MVKTLPANAGDSRDVGCIPGLERSPGGGNGNPLWCSCLRNPMNRGTWWATGSQRVRHNRATERKHSHTVTLYLTLGFTNFSVFGPDLIVNSLRAGTVSSFY